MFAAEVAGCLKIVKIIFTTLGMTDYRVRVGMRDPDSSKYVGEPEHWDKAEEACQEMQHMQDRYEEEFGFGYDPDEEDDIYEW